MTMVRIVGWKPGFKKVEFNWLLRECSGLSLAERKQHVDLILKGEAVVIEIAPDCFDSFLDRASGLGAICQVGEDS
jgi:hypothetical protein